MIEHFNLQTLEVHGGVVSKETLIELNSLQIKNKLFFGSSLQRYDLEYDDIKGFLHLFPDRKPPQFHIEYRYISEVENDLIIEAPVKLISIKYPMLDSENYNNGILDYSSENVTI